MLFFFIAYVVVGVVVFFWEALFTGMEPKIAIWEALFWPVMAVLVIIRIIAGKSGG